MCQPPVRRGAEALHGRFKLTEWVMRPVTYVVRQHDYSTTVVPAQAGTQ
ncbi:protein of unknown function (plasmid) [Cupriavidus taiwanensis]|uniref:Uncharacterized protein n=1 Tax=Cupriavidus taiwanensis TaxID=164546 RepID=A0A7Z7NNC3_9BURK|nr:protein of unknown function [Cupriavidus taiwanensis]SOZ11531.1 protein of unknown function [Cupriavidus taiwanensis]SOZ42886.1 protein of unknown function [Cupriavidus taiwanensis]SPC22133.1 protein of unknown function [Cupriavidus taiwanensis]SPD53636.1 protein of unknown function [Cupriavidus taiwanensis]